MIVVFLVIGSKVMKKRKNKAKDGILNTLNQHNLTIQELIFYGCKYVGGHPDRDSESNNIFFAKKNGKLIFFSGAMADDTNAMLKESFKASISIKNMNPFNSQKQKLEIGLVEGEQIPDRAKNDFYELNHLFDIPIDVIEDIRYFDATSSSTIGLVGGDYWAVPIKINKGDASVLIDWRDGKYGHSTEFRFVGLLRGRGVVLHPIGHGYLEGNINKDGTVKGTAPSGYDFTISYSGIFKGDKISGDWKNIEYPQYFGTFSGEKKL